MAHTDHVDSYELYESYESNCIVVVLTCLDRRLSLKILTKLIFELLCRKVRNCLMKFQLMHVH